MQLRFLVPCTMFFCVLMTIFFSFLGSRSIILSRVENTQNVLVRERIGTLQGILEHIAVKEKKLIAEILSLYGAAPDHDILMLTDQDGKVISSTHYEDIGLPWQETEFADRQVSAFSLREQSVLVNMSDDREKQDAYASICWKSEQRDLRNQICGVLYYRQNLGYHKDIALSDIYRLLSLISGGSIFLGFLLWGFLHQHLTRRTSDLIDVLERYSKGERDIDAQVSGHDELTKITSSINMLINTIYEDEIAIQRSEQRFRSLVENIPGAVYRSDIELPRHMLFLSKGIEKICSYSVAELLANPELKFFDLIDPDHREKVMSYIHTQLQEGEPFSTEYPLMNSKGETRWVLDIGREVTDATDKERYVEGIILDITERKKTEASLLNQQRMLKAMSLAAHDPMIIIDGQDNILFWNTAAEKLYGYSAEEVVQKRKMHYLICTKEDRELAYKGFEKFIQTGQGAVLNSVMEFQSVHRSGRLFPVERSVAAFQMDDTWYAVGSVRDITDRKNAEKALRSLATTDSLTSLNNRRHFLELSSKEISDAQRYAMPLAVFMFDVDYFKSVNDTYGHDIGDQVLKELAELSRKKVRDTDIIGRLGGEEFAVTLPNTERAHAEKAAERLRKAVAEHRVITAKRELTVTISIGVVMMEAGKECDIDALLKEADEALYRAKKQGRNCVIMA
ncbi:MAG: diguanylate cyclase [Candidatus Electrothrix scaldis]|nr:MAG: diguanylate cyclase [Candidatus Electrothrix sp. GW3-3]